jgi:hypothetical protein
MKPSLEEERSALLEQIEASRAVYRRMLAGEAGTSPSRSMTSAGAGPHASADKPTLRERVAQRPAVLWMMEHPLWVAGGVALLVLLAPKIRDRTTAIVRKRRAARQHDSQQQAARAVAGGTARALLPVALLLLRDPARMRAIARLAGAAWQWLLKPGQNKADRSITTFAPTAGVTNRSH